MDLLGVRCTLSGQCSLCATIRVVWYKGCLSGQLHWHDHLHLQQRIPARPYCNKLCACSRLSCPCVRHTLCLRRWV